MIQDMGTPQFMSTKDVATLLGKSITTIRSYAKQGRLPVHRIFGRTRVFVLEDVLNFWEQHCVTWPKDDLDEQKTGRRYVGRIIDGRMVVVVDDPWPEIVVPDVPDISTIRFMKKMINGEVMIVEEALGVVDAD